MFVLDSRATPMRIVAEYDRSTIHGNGCGGLESGGRMYVNSGGGTAANLSEFDVYAFNLAEFRNAAGTGPCSGAGRTCRRRSWWSARTTATRWTRTARC